MHAYEEFQSAELYRSLPQTPHRRVVNAVLMQAADDLRYLRARLRDRRYPQPHMMDAAMWVASDEERPFSFVWCCYMVGRDPADTRKKMLQGVNVEKLKEAMRL